jgi:hypothetical protein
MAHIVMGTQILCIVFPSHGRKKVQSRFSYFNLLGLKLSEQAKSVFSVCRLMVLVLRGMRARCFCFARRGGAPLIGTAAQRSIILHFRVSTPVCNL